MLKIWSFLAQHLFNSKKNRSISLSPFHNLKRREKQSIRLKSSQSKSRTALYRAALGGEARPAVFLVLLQVGFFHALVLTNICARVWSAKNDTKYERTDSNNRWRFAVAAAAALKNRSVKRGEPAIGCGYSREHTAEQNHGVLKFAKRRPCLATQRCTVVRFINYSPKR